ncbi:threonylcarbamoyl-AMP synthase [Chitiniphilus shinanonensis]|uniref:Threonylcarbamoyl-AMP synthase n=1 Tax=Chitiniphilus shinanonensis TaxID=553088 RepID=A0ABQ6BMT4_9NEIS|nr:L-threonylcarbamoyladenylate synthase [Chitiniphilus shinanonensis]GLS03218.1 threonylcarbamoyl-AMP synthase [Chitiniphilus shinanonensis]
MNELELALARLRAGELVAIPTETVYGLAADAANLDAVARIFALKGRPADHPVIVHIAGSAQLPQWARDIPDSAWKLAEAFWPGPLTLILKRQPHVLDAVTGGQDTVGLRAPAHPLTHELLVRFDGGLAAPSANRFGHVSPTRAHHVRDEFGAECPLVLDGGPCDVGVESTIVSLAGEHPVLLRPGGVTREAIEALLNTPLLHHQDSASAKMRASGLLDSHYSPRTPLVTGEYANILPAIEQALAAGEPIAIISIGTWPAHGPQGDVYPMPDNPEQYARLIYDKLRQLDKQTYSRIFLQLPPITPGWLAVNDRLRRAAHSRI